jgi:hypothetical protein
MSEFKRSTASHLSPIYKLSCLSPDRLQEQTVDFTFRRDSPRTGRRGFSDNKINKDGDWDDGDSDRHPKGSAALHVSRTALGPISLYLITLGFEFVSGCDSRGESFHSITNLFRLPFYGVPLVSAPPSTLFSEIKSD